MKFLTKVAGLVAAARLQEEALYARVHTEIEAGDIRQGLWLKALSDSNGNELQAKSKYAKARVKSLKDEAAVTKVILEEQEEAFRGKQRQEKAAKDKQRQEKAAKDKQRREKAAKDKQRREKAAKDKQKKSETRLLNETKSYKQESDLDEVKNFLELHNYKLKVWANGWEIREPLGGRVRLLNDDELIEYAANRGY